MTRVIVRGVQGASTREHTQAAIAKAVPNAEWVWDDKTKNDRGALGTFLWGLELAGADAVVFMEDDAIPCAGFLSKMEAIISERPGDTIQFFSNRKKDATHGSRYEQYFSYNICYYLHAMESSYLLKFYPVWATHEKAKPDSGCDLMINEFFRVRRLKHWIHVPSLVQHDSSPSLIDPRRSSKRFAAVFDGA